MVDINILSAFSQLNESPQIKEEVEHTSTLKGLFERLAENSKSIVAFTRSDVEDVIDFLESRGECDAELQRINTLLGALSNVKGIRRRRVF